MTHVVKHLANFNLQVAIEQASFHKLYKSFVQLVYLSRDKNQVDFM